MSWTSVTTNIICLQCDTRFDVEHEEDAFAHSSDDLHDIKFIYHDEYTMSAIEVLMEGDGEEEAESDEVAWHVNYSEMLDLLQQAYGGARPTDLMRSLNMNSESFGDADGEYEPTQQTEG